MSNPNAIDLAAFLGRIRDALDARRMSQADLGRRLSVRHATVTEWFTRGRVPNGLVMLRLPRILDVNPTWLFAGEGPRDRAAVPKISTNPADARQVIEELRHLLAALERHYGAEDGGEEEPPRARRRKAVAAGSGGGRPARRAR